MSHTLHHGFVILQRDMETAMRELAILIAIWVGMFFGLSRAARYSPAWAAVGATAMTSFVGIYVFLVDWHPPLH